MKGERARIGTRGAFAAGWLVAAALALAPSALADPVVYVTAGGLGAPPYPPLVLPAGSSTTVQLNMAESSTNPVSSDPSEVCTLNAGGDERCFWDVVIEAQGSVTLSGFTPNGSVVYGLQTTRVRLNGGDHVAGELAPVHLGDLSIVSTGTGTVRLTAGTVINAFLDRLSLPESTVIYVPEPGFHSGLAGGVGLLAALARWRRHRSASGRHETHAVRTGRDGAPAPLGS